MEILFSLNWYFMKLVLTKFLFPIKEKQILSKKFNLYFDNPRTKEEINYLTQYIKTSENPLKHTVTYWLFMDEIWFKDLLLNFKKNVNTPYVKTFFKKEKKNIYSNPIHTIAKMLVVIRYDDKWESEKLWEIYKKNWEEWFFLLDDDNPIVKSFNETVSFSSLLTLIAKDNINDWNNHDFLVHNKERDLNEFSFDRKLNQSLFFSRMYFYNRDYEDEASAQVDFELFLKQINIWAEKIDLFLENTNSDELERFSFIATEIQRISSLDEKSQLVAIVSVIELLVTHNPNFMRYNIEDSISKQFILKVSYIMYLDNCKINLNLLKSKLKLIYNLRSNIAHWNFKEINKYISTLWEDEYFYDIVEEVKKILQVVLRKYILDSSFIDFIKDN